MYYLFLGHLARCHVGKGAVPFDIAHLQVSLRSASQRKHYMKYAATYRNLSKYFSKNILGRLKTNQQVSALRHVQGYQKYRDPSHSLRRHYTNTTELEVQNPPSQPRMFISISFPVVSLPAVLAC
jgi:hypothetical protein